MTWILGAIGRNPLVLVWIALTAFAAGGGAAWKVQAWRLDAVQAKFDGFVEVTRAEGEAAKKWADAVEVANKQRKDRADAENARTIGALRAANRRMRDARATRSLLPAPAAGAGSPATASFNRPELERALRGFDLGVTELIDEGDEARVNLDTAKAWAQQPGIK
jgi:hypothetical protein